MYLRKLIYTIGLPLMMLFSLISQAQERVISGAVTDASGKGVPGVSVSVKGQTRGTTTNETGAYSLSVPASARTLVFSSVGYSPIEMDLANRTSVNVTLSTATGNLNEVVVVGYGTQRKRDLTGSVSAVSSKDFNKGAITTPEQLIAGKVAGVQITSNGGAPGSGSTIRIRGGASLNASNDPLIVIDGVPIAQGGIAGAANPSSLVNPNDIESFNVLKDASATAIYGSRASNGVIIITTKKGRSGKPRFSFTTQNSYSTLPKKADVLSADEFRTFVQTHGTSKDIALLGKANTDWQDQIFGKSFNSDNNLSVTGGIKNILPFRISLGYLKNNGILKTGYLDRKSVSLNLNPTLLNNHLKVDLNLKGSQSNTRFADEGSIGNAVRFDPTQPVVSGNNRYGGYFEWLDPGATTTGLKTLAPRNPLGLLEQRQDKSDVKRSIGNLQLDYKVHFLPDLHVNVNLGYDVSEGKGTVFVPDSAANSYRRSPDGKHGGVNNQYRQTKSNQLLETYLNYVKDIASISSRIDVMAGYSFQDFLTTNYNGIRDANGVLTDSLGRWTPYSDYTVDGVLISSPTYINDKPENSLVSYFGRLNYSLKGRYLLTATIRRDGSSRFSSANRWGVFPSGALAWRMKDENFLRSSKTISDLKLRIGYGITGQQEGIGNYNFIPRYSMSNLLAQYQLGNQFYYMYRPAGYNPNLKWEQTETYNAGLDYGLFSNRISGTVDVYYKKTKDLLSEIDQPAGTNFSNKITANIGNMENRGVEFTINAEPVRSQNLTWDMGFNITYNENKITNLTFTKDPTFPGNLVGGISSGVGSYIQIQSVGYPRNSFYVYQQVYDSSGKPIEGLFEDRNRDGLINNNDLYRYKSPDPKVFLGFNTNVNWYKWTAGFSLRANIGNYMYNGRFANTGVQRNLIDPLGYLANGSRSVLETNFVGAGDKYFLSDYYLENASFLRMDNINIGYNAGNVVGKNTNLRAGITVQNAFVITKYKGLDPEVPGGIDNNFYPRPRNYVLSLGLDF